MGDGRSSPPARSRRPRDSDQARGSRCVSRIQHDPGGAVMTNIYAAVKEYLNLGWKVVPLNPGEKRASVKWQTTNYGPDSFNPDSNVAVKLGDPSGGLVDVDCDHP